MKRHLVVVAMLSLAAGAQAQVHLPTEPSSPTLWSRLWRNADQRAEALLQQGHASEAAKLYTDPRRKAYAQIRAGDYAAAVSGLNTLNDTEANYNRGNALAQLGDLQGALEAYDAALKTDPAHQDTIHNRDLVAKALQKQKESEKNKPQDKKDGGQSGQQSSKPDPGQTQQAGNDAEQARRDVNATVQPNAKKGTEGDAGTAQENPTPPVTEKQIAQEQWLRSIPDNPGGLLRRQFLIRHLMRQRDAKP